MTGPTGNDRTTSIRRAAEALEDQTLAPGAARSRATRGRDRPEDECPIRTAFQRDRDRIIHSKAFRRLKDKTQVFFSPRGDHYRTRLTHSLEVSQIARTIARGLRLNEDLAEAIALAHDLGHTPFGHAGEAALDAAIPGGFRHNEQSLRVVARLEKDGRGLNLTWEVRDGILSHVPARRPATYEGQIVQLADRVAYVNHDIDDAVRAGVLGPEDLPHDALTVLGRTGAERIGTLVLDVIEANRQLVQRAPAAEGTADCYEQLRPSSRVAEVADSLHEFMFERVYLRDHARAGHARVRRMLGDLYLHYVREPDSLAEEYSLFGSTSGDPGEGKAGAVERAAADYVAGMTDRFAIECYIRHFLPETWGE